MIRIDDSNILNSWYLAAEKTVVVGRQLASDIDMLRWSYTQHVLKVSNYKQEIGKPTSEIENGLADYLVCSFKNKPNMGETLANLLKYDKSYLRNMENERFFNNLSEDNTGPHSRGEIWGGAFWEIRTHLGQEIADRILVLAWRTTAWPTAEQDKPQKFIEALLSAAKGIGPSPDRQVNEIKTILQRRKFPALN